MRRPRPLALVNRVLAAMLAGSVFLVFLQ